MRKLIQFYQIRLLPAGRIDYFVKLERHHFFFKTKTVGGTVANCMEECTSCPGYCCIKQPGAVLLVDAEDINRLARHFGLADGELRRHYMEGRHSLKVREDGSCIFREAARFAAGCTIYPARPRQCREFPFGRPCPYLDRQKSSGEDRFRPLSTETTAERNENDK